MSFTVKKTAILIFCCLSLLFVSTKVSAQQKNNASPKWVTMMNDPNANFYETVKAFRKFWKNKPLPREPFESEELEIFEKEVGLVGEKESEEERERELKKKKRDPKAYDYADEVKAFKGWYQRVKPWVKEDGTIMTEDEQQKLIDKQQAELKEIEKKNGKN